jgi:hypothetical protein
MGGGPALGGKTECQPEPVVRETAERVIAGTEDKKKVFVLAGPAWSPPVLFCTTVLRSRKRSAPRLPAPQVTTTQSLPHQPAPA